MVNDERSEHTRLLSSKRSSAYAPRLDRRAARGLPGTVYRLRIFPRSALRTPSGSSVGIASKPDIWAKIMRLPRRPPACVLYSYIHVGTSYVSRIP